MTSQIQKTHWYDCFCCFSSSQPEEEKKQKEQKRVEKLRKHKIDDMIVVVVEGKIQLSHQRLQSTEVISINRALQENPE